jgi:DNA-binding IscR family transcriptional regulator
VAQVIDALEGPVAVTECTGPAGTCEQEAHCSVRGNWERINDAIRLALSDITLAEMVRPAVPAVVDMSGLRAGPAARRRALR